MRNASSQVKMSGSEKIIKVNMNTGNKIFGKYWLNLYIRTEWSTIQGVIERVI